MAGACWGDVIEVYPKIKEFGSITPRRVSPKDLAGDGESPNELLDEADQLRSNSSP
jgi:hypothetical protein